MLCVMLSNLPNIIVYDILYVFVIRFKRYSSSANRSLFTSEVGIGQRHDNDYYDNSSIYSIVSIQIPLVTMRVLPFVH